MPLNIAMNPLGATLQQSSSTGLASLYGLYPSIVRARRVQCNAEFRWVIGVFLITAPYRPIFACQTLVIFQHDQGFTVRTGCGRLGSVKCDESAKHKDSKYEGKADLEEMSCLLEGNTRTLYEIYKRNSAGFREAVCVWAFESTRDSRESTRCEFVLNTSQ